jgi:hypothetical protein
MCSAYVYQYFIMATMSYTLQTFNDIISNGFNIDLSAETLSIISKLSQEVGSPDYVKTPVFLKKVKFVESNMDPNKKKKGGHNSDLNWEVARSFKSTKLEEKVGVDAKIDCVRSHLNKMTDKNYIDIRNKIIDVIDTIVSDGEDMSRVSVTIFEIASNNRFFSKIYADLYSDLMGKYDVMKTVFEESLSKFTALFDCIEHGDSIADYDKFCKINKDNEKRKALSAFFVNLMHNNIISNEDIAEITMKLMIQLYTFISQDDKKNEVDELSENIAILYNKNLLYIELIDGLTITEVIVKLSKSKMKDYKSLTNKTIFKFMDLIEKS